MQNLILIFILSLFIIGCATSPLELKRLKVKDCTKEMIEHDTIPIEAYKICKDIYKRK